MSQEHDQTVNYPVEKLGFHLDLHEGAPGLEETEPMQVGAVVRDFATANWWGRAVVVSSIIEYLYDGHEHIGSGGQKFPVKREPSKLINSGRDEQTFHFVQTSWRVRFM